MEKAATYFAQYSQIISLSLIYFAATSFTGVFLILRRASLYGMVLSQVAQVSFLLGMATAALFKGHEHVYDMINRASRGTGNEWHFLEIDLFIIPITLLLLSPFVWAAVRGVRNKEAVLVLGLLFFLAAYPLVNKGFGGSDAVLAKAYFTEILYTPAEMFVHYLPAIGMLMLLFGVLFKRILLSGFDPVQARLSGIRPDLYNAIFFFSAGLVLSIAVRILGAYVSMAALLVPGFIALQMLRQMRSVIILTLVLSVILPLMGFVISFTFDNLPAEPLLTVFYILAAFLLLSARKGLILIRMR